MNKEILKSCEGQVTMSSSLLGFLSLSSVCIYLHRDIYIHIYTCTLYIGLTKITADGDCSHEFKRHLLLGRKVMTNLDSILKSRDNTLPTKVHLVKAMVFPVVMYGRESWTIKKAEC